MAYRCAGDLLPEELLEAIQNYVDGEYIYIPRKESNRKKWGETTKTRQDINLRNMEIYNKYQRGCSIQELENTYYLANKTIYKIIAKYKNK